MVLRIIFSPGLLIHFAPRARAFSRPAPAMMAAFAGADNMPGPPGPQLRSGFD
jgi:hypothetical protein